MEAQTTGFKWQRSSIYHFVFEPSIYSFYSEMQISIVWLCYFLPLPLPLPLLFLAESKSHRGVKNNNRNCGTNPFKSIVLCILCSLARSLARPCWFIYLLFVDNIAVVVVISNLYMISDKTSLCRRKIKTTRKKKDRPTDRYRSVSCCFSIFLLSFVRSMFVCLFVNSVCVFVCVLFLCLWLFSAIDVFRSHWLLTFLPQVFAVCINLMWLLQRFSFSFRHMCLYAICGTAAENSTRKVI